MPDLQDIELFKKELNSLGNERDVLARRGESIEDIPVPEEGLSEDLSELLGEFSDMDREAEEPADSGPAGGEIEGEEIDIEDIFPAESFEADGAGESDDETTGPPEPLIRDEGFEEIDEEDLSGFELPNIFEEEPASEGNDVFPDETIEEPEEPDYGIPEGLLEVAGEAVESETVEGEAGEAAEEPYENGMDFTAELEALTGLSGEDREAVPAGTDESPFEDFESLPDESEFALPSAEMGEEIPEEGSVPVPEDMFGEAFDIGPVEPEPEPEPAEEMGGFSEEDFSIPDEYSIETEDFEGPAEEESFGRAESAFEGPEIGTPSADQETEEAAVDDFEVDEFSLGSLGEAFGVTDDDLKEGVPPEEELNPAMAVGTAAVPFDREIAIGESDFDLLQKNLARLPRNLRIAIEELIGEQELGGEDLEKMVGMLVAGASAGEIAAYTGKLTGTAIEIPAQYIRGSGAAFEAERGTFAYAFRHSILPMIRMVAAVTAAIGILVFAGYQLGYRPIYAETLYRAGFRDLMEDRYPSANESFERAVGVWRVRKWFFEYAEAYIGKNMFALAAEKYEQLLRYQTEEIDGVEVSTYVFDRQGLLDYARMESEYLANFPKAEELLKRVLERDMYDREALIMAGDNYLSWGDEDDDRYEDARFSYAVAMQKHGQSTDLLFRMLRFFIRTDNLDEVVRLKDRFQADRRADIDPGIYAETAGYLIGKGAANPMYLSDVRDILFRAMDRDKTLPEIHYHLARFFREINDYGEELSALKNAEIFFEAAGTLDRERRSMQIDTFNRLGSAYARREEDFEAETYFNRGIRTYESALASGILSRDEMHGSLYANLADIYYYVRNVFDVALLNYEEAEANGYVTPETRYKMGYIHYRAGAYDDAVLRFYEAAGNYSTDDNLLYATANTLFRRGRYASAQGYFNHLLDILEEQRASIRYLRPAEDPAHRALVENLMKAYNNMGVTLFRLRVTLGSDDRYSDPMVYLSKSSELYDVLSRNPATMTRAQTVNLAYLNARSALYPTAEYELEIYSDIPKDLEMTTY